MLDAATPQFRSSHCRNGFATRDAGRSSADHYIQVMLAHPVPKGGAPGIVTTQNDGCGKRPDTPARVLLAVIAKHPESVGDVLKDVR